MAGAIPSTEPMKIVYLCPSFPSGPLNGYESVVACRAQALRNVVEAHAILCQPRKGAGQLNPEFRELFKSITIVEGDWGARVRGVLGCLANGLPIQTAAFPQRRLRNKVKYVIREIKPDIID